MPRSRRAKFGKSWVTFGNFKWGQSLSNRYRRLTQATNTQGSILLDIDLDGKHLYLSDKYITVESYEHEGVVVDWGSSDLAAGSSVSELSDISITLFNKRLMYMSTDTRISEMFNDYSFEGRTATFRQYFDGLNYDECAIFHTGKIDSLSFDDLYIYIDIVDDEDVFKELPLRRISKQEYSEAPKESIGIGKPLVYGVPETTNFPSYDRWTLWPSVVTSERTNKIMIADHKIAEDSYDNSGASGYIYKYISELQTYAYLYSSSITYSNTSAGCFATLAPPITMTLKIYPKFVGNEHTAGADISNLIDNNDSTTYTVNASEKLYVKFGKLPDLGTLAKGASVNITVWYNVSSVTSTTTYKYYNSRYDNGTGGTSTGSAIGATGLVFYFLSNDNTAHGERDDQGDQDDPWTWNQLSDYEFGVECDGTGEIVLKEMYLEVRGIPVTTTDMTVRPAGVGQYIYNFMTAGTPYRKQEIKGTEIGSIYSQMNTGGAEFGAWVDTAAGVARSNGFNEGDAIECPPYIIEDILRRALGQTDDNIDYDSFDNAGNTTNGTIKDWKFFGAITKIENSKDILQRLCMQSKSRLFRDADGMFSFWTYDTSASITYSDYKFDKDNNISGLSIRRSPRSGIANTVRINYMLDRGSGNYQRQTFIEVNKKYSGSMTAEAVDTSETAIDVDSGSDFSNNDVILINHEVMVVDSISTNTLTVQRGQYNSITAAHDDNTSIYILETNSDDGTGSQDQNAAAPNDREDDAIESAWRYDVTQPFELDCDFIIDDTTAQELREHYFDYLKAPKYIIEFDTFLNASDLIVNDIFEFDDSVMDSYMKLGGSSWSGQKFICMNIERTGNLKYHVVGEHLTYEFI